MPTGSVWAGVCSSSFPRSSSLSTSSLCTGAASTTMTVTRIWTIRKYILVSVAMVTLVLCLIFYLGTQYLFQCVSLYAVSESGCVFKT
jgi:hypothetical protein